MTRNLYHRNCTDLMALIKVEIDRLYREAKWSPRPEMLVKEERKIIESSYSPSMVFDKAVEAHIDYFLLPLINSILETIAKIKIENQEIFTTSDKKIIKILHTIAIEEWEAAAKNAYIVSEEHVIYNNGSIQNYKVIELSKKRDEYIASSPSNLLAIISEMVVKVSEECNLKITNRGMHLKSQTQITAASPILLLIVLLCGFFGAILFFGGVYLALKSRIADTKLNLLGNDLSSTSVGVTIAFIGVVLCIFTFRRVLKSVDHLAGLSNK